MVVLGNEESLDLSINNMYGKRAKCNNVEVEYVYFNIPGNIKLLCTENEYRSNKAYFLSEIQPDSVVYASIYAESVNLQQSIHILEYHKFISKKNPFGKSQVVSFPINYLYYLFTNNGSSLNITLIFLKCFPGHMLSIL